VPAAGALTRGVADGAVAASGGRRPLGYTWSDALTFDELLAWAGVDLAGLEREVSAYSPTAAAAFPLNSEPSRM
jgi:hypothetical protein